MKSLYLIFFFLDVLFLGRFDLGFNKRFQQWLFLLLRIYYIRLNPLPPLEFLTEAKIKHAKKQDIKKKDKKETPHDYYVS